MKVRRLLIFGSLILGSGAATAQTRVQIGLDPVGCWPDDRFLAIRSTFEPADDVATARLYFRSSEFLDYYFVELALEDDGGRAVLPKAAPETPEIVYFLELFTTSYEAFRTAEQSASVGSASECLRQNETTAFYTGEDRELTIGRTRPGAPRIPPGLQPDGITGTLSPEGFSEGGGGRTIGIVAGVGAGAGAAILLAGGRGSESSTTAPGGTPSTPVGGPTSTVTGGVPSTTTSSTAGGGGTSSASTTALPSSTTSVPGGSTTSSTPGSTTTISISTSTTTSVGVTSSTTSAESTTTTAGTSSTTTAFSTTTTSISPTTTIPPTTSIQPTSTTSTAFTTTTTSTPSTTTIPATTTTAASTADLGVTLSGSRPTSVGRNFEFDIEVENLGRGTATSVQLRATWTAGLATFIGMNNPACGSLSATQASCTFPSLPSGGSVSVRLTLQATQTGTLTNSVSVTLGSPNDPSSSNNSASVTIRINPLLAEATTPLELSYRSRIEIEQENAAIGQIVLNGGSYQQTDDSGEFTYTTRVKDGVNRMEAQLPIAGNAFGSWRFDFGGSPGFVPGSFRVESGQVLSQDGTSIAFAGGGAAPPLRYTFEVAERR